MELFKWPSYTGVEMAQELLPGICSYDPTNSKADCLGCFNLMVCFESPINASIRILHVDYGLTCNHITLSNVSAWMTFNKIHLLIKLHVI